MKVLALRADMGGCAKYRIHEPVKVLREQYGWDITIDNDIAIDGEKVLETGEYIIREVQEDVDLIVVQRPLNRSLLPVIEKAQEQGMAVIVEIDDDFHSVHPQNSAWKKVHPTFSPASNYEWLMKSSSIADLVTISTPALLHYAPHGRSRIIPNFVPDDIFDVKATPYTKTGLGWTGTRQTHPGDLESTQGSIGKALRKAKQDFHLVGDPIGVSNALGLADETIMHSTGWVDIDNYYQTMKDNISVGIVPLERSQFNEAKSYLKGLELAALGIPFVATPTYDYRRLHEDYGVGILAESPDEWYKAVTSLLTKPARQYMLGNKYRETVKNHLTYSQNAHLWADAWESAVAYRKSL